ncbi:major facilitator superfamily domain-containing protein [Microdochium trichocladiopsis]|uniref:Major facilitator superfamily domain-containing protein n=1 Tax=Microdochium trichocladiopsis TaxID=1682393 RepID=A0A9P8YCU7_9PEZI|nr:major facilitator superfamily domain-containing protein [Microdochium trichocladiopsis]KAH7035932.1 major facilitator superfamily domain-containing protein [Microdochium trichocladiopsis]
MNHTPSVDSDDGWGDVAKPGDTNALPGTEEPLRIAERKKYSVFTVWQKRGIVLLAAAGAFFSPLTGQIYFPSLPTIASEFGVSVADINLTVTVYMIFQGITPMFVAPFSDQTGRRPAYIVCFVVYLAGNVGCALAPNYPVLMVTRIIQSAGASTTIALCQSVVSDMVTSAERGQYVGWTALPIILAPCIGPVIGGLFAEFLGWRWNFWFLTILAGVVAIVLGMYMPETCRNIVDDGSVVPRNFYRPWWPVIKEKLALRKAAKADNFEMNGMEQKPKAEKTPIKIKGINPTRAFLLLLEPEMFLLLLYSSLIFAGFYAMATAMPTMLAKLYGFDELMTGAMYTPMGVGSLVAAFVMGRVQNKNFERHAALRGMEVHADTQQDLKDFPIEKVRLEVAYPLVALFVVCIIGWGWAFEYWAPVYVPAIILFFIGVAMVGFTNSINILLVDINPGIAGAAAAVSNFTRCMFGAAASAAISPMLIALGPGWSFTILGLLYVVCAPMLWLVVKNGMVWREKKMIRRQARMKKIMEKQREKAMAEARAMGIAMQAAASGDDVPGVPDIAAIPSRPPTIDDPYFPGNNFAQEPSIAALRIPDPRLSVWGETGLRGSLWVGNSDQSSNTAPSANTNRYSVWDSGEDWVPTLQRQSTWGRARNRESVMWGARDSAMFGGF